MALRIWEVAARNAAIIAILTLLAGLFLTAASFALGLHDVKFEGQVAGVAVIGFPDSPGFAKQVGYAWAPNWMLVGVLLLPLAIFNLLLAIRSVEALLHDLVEAGMIRRRNFNPVESEVVIGAWRHQAGRWALVGLGVAILSGLFIALFDFWPVVLEWLLMDEDSLRKRLTDPAGPVKFAHPSHEFDWSVAATFDGASIGVATNVAFSSVAYLVIAIVGMSVVFGAFIFLCAFCAFFSETMRHDLDLVLIPDLSSKDPRCGFERFENFFHHLVMAAIFTGAMAVSMHLQNVFLRSPQHQTIFDMVFGNAKKIFDQGLLATAPKEYIDYLTSMSSVVDMTDIVVSLQTYAAALVLFMVGAIVFICLWIWLRRAAVDGRLAYANQSSLGKQDAEKLNEMKVWPIGWISLDLLLAIGVVVFLSMWFVNFVSLVFLVFALKALSAVSAALFDAVRDTLRRRRRDGPRSNR